MNKQPRNHRIFCALFALVLCIQLLCSVAFALEVTSVGFNTITKEYEFSLCSDNASGNAVVGLYDEAGALCSMGSKALSSSGDAVVKLPYCNNHFAYKAMLWSQNNNLQPLSSSAYGNMDTGIHSRSVTLLADNVLDYDVENGALYYSLDDEEYTIALDKNAPTMLYNDEPYEFDGSEFLSFLEEEDTILYLTDTDSNALYEGIEVCMYDYDIVDYVDEPRDKLSLLDSGSVWLDFEETTVVITDFFNNPLSLSDLNPGDFIAVLCDNPGNIKRYREHIKIIKLTDSDVTGTVDEVYSRGGDDYVVVDSKTYINETGEEFVPGNSGKFYITLSNKVFYYTIDYSTLNYGYIMEGELIDNNWYFTLLTDDGDIITAEAADSDAATEYIDDNYRSFDVVDNKFLFEDATENQKRNSARFVTYVLDETGKISVKIADNYNFESIDTDSYIYNKTNDIIGDCKLKDDALIFDVSSGVKGAIVTDKSHLRDNMGYSGFLFSRPDEKSVYSVMLITSSKDFSVESSKNIAIALETDGTTITFVQSGREKKLPLENAQILNASGKLPKCGDVFYYYDINADQNIDSIITVATLEKDADNRAYFVLTPEADTSEKVSKIWDDDKMRIEVGYILNEGPRRYSDGEMITLSDNRLIKVHSAAYIYLYDDGVKISDYLEYAYEENGTLMSYPILIRTKDETAYDVYFTMDAFAME